MTSSDLYRHITDAAHESPGWLHSVAEFGTDAGLVVLLVVVAAAWWRARLDSARQLALTLLVPVGTALAYGISELAKTVVDEERPCRAVPDAAPPIAACPEPGDWSFPSNHATLAAALAVGAVLAWRRTAPLVLPLAVLLACSRVFVGVHYPHDVVAGCVLGGLVAYGCTRLAAAPVTARVERIRGAAGPVPGHRAGRASGAGRPLRLLVGPGPAPVGAGHRAGPDRLSAGGRR
ncbi:phosphatase PAP2 family protein [Streptomyces sp. NPDC018031]|uniref:phosphatase PAP2 family protein n=1 Tax=Streptomyces sp. NPDC018031 TaxID=3365033 RepID=UPI0037B55F01